VNGGQKQAVSPEKQAGDLPKTSRGVGGCPTPNDLCDGGWDLCSQHAGSPPVGGGAWGQGGGYLQSGRGCGGRIGHSGSRFAATRRSLAARTASPTLPGVKACRWSSCGARIFLPSCCGCRDGQGW